jgi:hypothetical protein
LIASSSARSFGRPPKDEHISRPARGTEHRKRNVTRAVTGSRGPKDARYPPSPSGKVTATAQRVQPSSPATTDAPTLPPIASATLSEPMDSREGEIGARVYLAAVVIASSLPPEGAAA